jgi:hypothetical protein
MITQRQQRGNELTNGVIGQGAVRGARQVGTSLASLCLQRLGEEAMPTESPQAVLARTHYLVRHSDHLLRHIARRLAVTEHLIRGPHYSRVDRPRARARLTS